eukprot:2959578-Amphidinium_carterae.1
MQCKAFYNLAKSHTWAVELEPMWQATQGVLHASSSTNFDKDAAHNEQRYHIDLKIARRQVLA